MRWKVVSASFLSFFCWTTGSFGADEILLLVVVSPVCDSYVRPETLVRICDECNFGTYGGRCIICGSPGEAYTRTVR
jgi:hypothetical protein